MSQVEEAETLDQVALLLSESVVALAGVKPHWAEMWRRRHGWGCAPETLDALGQRVGVTRERVRQVVMKLDSAADALNSSPIPEVLVTAIELIDWDSAEDQHQALVCAELVKPGSFWKATAICDLLAVLGCREAADVLSERQARATLGPDQSLLDAVRRGRDKSGLLDMRAVEFEQGLLALETVGNLLPHVFKHSWVSGNWALCRGAKLTSVENTALQQLRVAESLDADELCDGINRVMRKRGWTSAPNATIVALLRQAGVIEIVDGVCTSTGALSPSTLGENDSWLVAQLLQAPGEALTTDELLHRATSDGISRGSLNVHMTYSPLVRRDGGVIRLVGSRPSSTLRAQLKRAAKADRVATSYSIHAHSDGFILDFCPGTVALNTGVVSMRKDLRTIVGNTRHTLYCCPTVEFEGQLAVSQRVSWYNWSPLFNHWVEHHGVRPGDRIELLITDEVVKCLGPWPTAVEPLPDESFPPGKPDSQELDPASDSTGPDDPLREQSRSVISGVSANAEAVRPGDVWPGKRGSRVLVLSPKVRDLVSQDKKKQLSTTVGSAALQVAKEWLEIRRTGGRVWVNDAGDACTKIDGELVYLGRIPPDWRW